MIQCFINASLRWTACCLVTAGQPVAMHSFFPGNEKRTDFKSGPEEKYERCQISVF